MSSTNPTARPPKAPQLSSMPSTPGPQVPGGYPRNSVVFATNQWDHSAEKGKPGLLAATKAYLPPAVASFLPPSTDPRSPLPRASSAGHTPGVALHTSSGGSGAASDSDSSTPMPTPGEFPTPGGRTFAARASSHLNSSITGTADAERDYFGAAAVAGGEAPSSENPDSSEHEEPAPAAEEERCPQDVDTGVVLPSSSSAHPDREPTPASASASAPSATSSSSIASPASTSSPSNSSSSGSGSAASTPSTASTTPSSLPSISSPKSLRYAPTTSPSRPSVTKAGSAAGFGLGATVRRFASVRSRARRNEQGPGNASGEKGHARGVSLDSSAAIVSEDTPASPRAISPILAQGTNPAGTSPTVNANAKPSRRVSLMRALRGEASSLAGRVRGMRGARASPSS